MKESGPPSYDPMDRPGPEPPDMLARPTTGARPLVIGLFVLAGVVFIAAVLGVLVSLTDNGSNGTVPPPSDASSDEYLKLQTLGTTADFFVVGEQPGVDAGTLYRDAIVRTIEANGKAPAAAVNMVIQAADAANINQGFIDQLMPLSTEQDQEVLNAFEALVRATAQRATSPTVSANEARTATLATLRLTVRAFELNSRLPIRQQAAVLTLGLGAELHNEVKLESEQSAALADLLLQMTTVMRYWYLKLDVLEGTPLNVNDLQVIAANDEDLSFRVAAVRRAGRLANLATSGPQREVVRRLLDDATVSDEPQIREAAELAKNEMPAD